MAKIAAALPAAMAIAVCAAIEMAACPPCSPVQASATGTGWQIQFGDERAGAALEIVDWHLSSAYVVRGLGLTASFFGLSAGGGATYEDGYLFVGGGVEAGGRMLSDGTHIRLR